MLDTNPSDHFLFPPVKESFKPDPGYVIADFDLTGADARVVAWDSGDEGYKGAFRSGLKIHAANAMNIFGKERAGEDGKKEPYYTKAKKGVHATSYGATPPALAERCGMTKPEAVAFQRDLFRAYPGLKEWQKAIEFEVQTKRMLYNKFGYRIVFFDRPESCFNQALAWRPQSTVAEVTYRAMIEIAEKLREVQLLLQVHDSLLIQIPRQGFRSHMRNIYEILHSIEVPYDDPLIIPWGVKTSEVSWGAVKERKWEELL